MAKGQKRSGREVKKPKASKTAAVAPPSALQPRPPLKPSTKTQTK